MQGGPAAAKKGARNVLDEDCACEEMDRGWGCRARERGQPGCDNGVIKPGWGGWKTHGYQGFFELGDIDGVGKTWPMGRPW
jgi:hypothetical protein